MKKGDPAMKDVVTESRKDMNDFVAVRPLSRLTHKRRRSLAQPPHISHQLLLRAISPTRAPFGTVDHACPVSSWLSDLERYAWLTMPNENDCRVRRTQDA